MDIDLAHTFLAVVESGSFVSAAERVHVTQSTVSMRIKSLEDRLGKPLFERSKSGTKLTPAGLLFQRHAMAMVRVWEQARLEIALPPGYRAALTIGGQYSLWDGFLMDWVSRMRAAFPDIALRMQLGFSRALMQRMVDGTLDMGVMYTPESRPGFDIEMLFEEELVLATSAKQGEGWPGRNYVYVDWGPEFQADHSLNFPDLSTPGLYMEIGSLGLSYLLQNAGSGYFPRRVVQPYVDAGRLSVISSAPVFSYPAYVIYPADADPDLQDAVLTSLREIAVQHRPC